MGRYLVVESTKAGPGLYLAQGKVVDTAEFPDKSAKFQELAEAGLLVAFSGKATEAPAEPPTPEAPEAPDEKKKGK